jgi:hypothetical protein
VRYEDRIEATARALFEKEHARFRRQNPDWAAQYPRAKSWAHLTPGQQAKFKERAAEKMQ